MDSIGRLSSNTGGSTNSVISGISSLMTSTNLLIFCAVVLFAITAFFYYFTYVAPQLESIYKPNNEKLTGDPSKMGHAELLFFYANWCPHCKAAKPIWNELKTEYEGKTINGYKIQFTDVDCTEETAETDKLMNQYNVEGYPTIKLIKDGEQVIEYDAKPTKSTLVQFLNTVL
jgi:thiol-disulfide isomerase/thioredoxin